MGCDRTSNTFLSNSPSWNGISILILSLDFHRPLFLRLEFSFFSSFHSSSFCSSCFLIFLIFLLELSFSSFLSLIFSQPVSQLPGSELSNLECRHRTLRTAVLRNGIHGDFLGAAGHHCSDSRHFSCRCTSWQLRCLKISKFVSCFCYLFFQKVQSSWRHLLFKGIIMGSQEAPSSLLQWPLLVLLVVQWRGSSASERWALGWE